MPDTSHTVRISGSTISGAAFATGDNARASVTTQSSGTDLQAVLQALTALRESLKTLPDEPESAAAGAQATAMADAVEQEVTSQNPRREHAVTFMKSLAESLTGIASVGETVKALTDAVTKFFT